jgi:hypothetical protein
MNALTAILLALQAGLPQALQDPEPVPPRTDVFVRARGGAWSSHGFDFHAVRSDGIEVSTDGETLGTAALDLGVSILERAVIFASAEAAGGSGLAIRTAGLHAGIRERLAEPRTPTLPHEVTVYAGGLWSTAEARDDRFGDFDEAWGFSAGLQFTWFLSRTWAFSLAAEYRHLRYDYEEEVNSGDTKLGGSGAWGGAALEARF